MNIDAARHLCMCTGVGLLAFMACYCAFTQIGHKAEKMIYLMNIAFGIAPQNNPVKVKARQRILDLFFSM